MGTTSGRVLAHRGAWTRPDERNTLSAFAAAFDRGWGVELDVRDAGGALVISHDPPRGGEPGLAEVLDLHERAGSPGTVAVNVKADGLQDGLARAFAGRATDWFAFDMSVPDARLYAQAGLPFFTRHSDLEPAPCLLNEALGVWLDAFDGEWWDADVLAGHLRDGRRVAVVSPELHRRPHADAWARWSGWPQWSDPALLLCTDHPTAAEEAIA